MSMNAYRHGVRAACAAALCVIALSAQDKARAAANGSRGVEAPGTPASAARPVKRPSQGVTDTTDCATWRRLYLESEACFGPFRTVGGGIKAEAFEACTVIPSPEPKCGPPRR